MNQPATNEIPPCARPSTALTAILLVVLLLMPLAVVFTEALRHGLDGVLDTFAEPDAIASIELTLIVAAVTVPLNAGVWHRCRLVHRPLQLSGPRHADHPDRTAVLLYRR